MSRHGRIDRLQFAHPFLPEMAIMAKPTRKIKKANHGKRPANSQARKSKRQVVRT